MRANRFNLISLSELLCSAHCYRSIHLQWCCSSAAVFITSFSSFTFSCFCTLILNLHCTRKHSIKVFISTSTHPHNWFNCFRLFSKLMPENKCGEGKFKGKAVGICNKVYIRRKLHNFTIFHAIHIRFLSNQLSSFVWQLCCRQKNEKIGKSENRKTETGNTHTHAYFQINTYKEDFHLEILPIKIW